MDDSWIPGDEWRTVVANVPIVSVDLVIRCDGGVVLGRRTNEPAKGYWFVPGGRVLKGETRSEAVHRVAEEELALEVEIVESFGAFEHQYESSDIAGVDSNTTSRTGMWSTWLMERWTRTTNTTNSGCFGRRRSRAMSTFVYTSKPPQR